MADVDRHLIPPTYQGEVVSKDAYKRRFLGESSRTEGYDNSRLLEVLQVIVASSVAMAVKSMEDQMTEDELDSDARS